MTGLILLLICILLISLSVWLFQRGLRQAGTDRVLERLADGQPLPQEPNGSWIALERMFQRAGLGKPTDRLGLWLSCWAVGMLLGYLLADWLGLLTLLIAPPLLLRLYIAWRYQRRVQRMIEQLPQLLDHSVRSLKSGRTLADAVLGAIDSTEAPLKQAMSRIQRNVQMGVSLPESVSDFAEFYERDEFRLFALGLKVNHRYGGNASELLENLIKMIREREQGARQLKAMTGETRMTAYVLAGLPIVMVGYFLMVNPGYLMSMWNDGTGRYLLLAAVALDITGTFVMWRMLRSI
ncbi:MULTISPECIES: type II secretion system F family protein [Pseudomonas]|jgi:tight adherence protein B|uniref:type II secretion system F family protein n=1 Tax=Pseudomonas TaxID=286 RepID=UPI001C0A8E1C|nr:MULTISPECIES: type II secretion system F family protein [Pseudomonas]MCK3840655.1 type II secretion system F family protein [Pseudomonas sp. NCIMB 10586]MCK3843253.1 type II secretion system F family protein [Pseudomonas sp. W15Feb34]MCK3851759.1 type II secretion system F family protein [Pseudomonas sp. W2Jun17]MCK3861201.1 type II secretion system F family protein [Pseudomonas sp. B329]UEH09115.1 type II secretion system F family protein [Pseudomonas sp. HN8-3]